MSVEGYKLPGLFWKRNCKGLYLDVEASMNYADMAWYERNYPKMELADARKYVRSALEKIANNPKAVAYRTAEFRRLEKKANAEFRSKSPEERDKWLRRYSRLKHARDNNERKKNGMEPIPYIPRTEENEEPQEDELEVTPEEVLEQKLPKQNKKRKNKTSDPVPYIPGAEENDEEQDDATEASHDDFLEEQMPGQNYMPLEKVVGLK